MLRTRHKTPTLVSMWMLDVFCCALGCVTLLWLVSNRDAAQEAQRNKAAISELAATRSTLLATSQELEATRRSLNAEIDNLKAKLLATTTDRDTTAQKLAVAKAEITNLETKLAKSTTDVASLETQLAKTAVQLTELDDELAKKTKESKDLTMRVAALTESSTDLQKLLRDKDAEREALALKAKKAAEQLDDADAKMRAIAKAADDAKADLAAMRKSGDELATAKAATRDLQKKLDDANVNIVDLQGDKKKLADKVDQLRIESDAKFAGIAMTGRRVVFVVDMSGSMKLVDDKTAAPEKWPIVVETVTKVMRSLPDLEQFQVVLFSRTARYLFAGGAWQRYAGAESQKAVREKLLNEDPVGDTNMYEAFDLAFRLKPDGLDTIYFFSDGLPTSGAGIPPDVKNITENQRIDYLTKHIRQSLRTVWNPERDAKRVKINSVGFFFESPEVGAFLWALSRENAGSFVGMSRP
ncbi:vWA domain-containing protein [Limnoglobus roseus]|uniref:VWA domain-containing protein n=1 Tax=Limnoglobus roseus TaxID=2598579 RepID=A0A5C1AED4_9BACT|nr:vWA domain-containing protein [Limnoglobus roseus]QEL17080.1 VWA domain-containing protein [Limnoglobus roseus]